MRLGQAPSPTPLPSNLGVPKKFKKSGIYNLCREEQGIIDTIFGGVYSPCACHNSSGIVGNSCSEKLGI